MAWGLRPQPEAQPPRPGAGGWASGPEPPPPADPAGPSASPHHALAVFRVHQEESLSVPPAEVPGPLSAGETEPGAAQPGLVPGHRVPRPGPLGQMGKSCWLPAGRDSLPNSGRFEQVSFNCLALSVLGLGKWVEVLFNMFLASLPPQMTCSEDLTLVMESTLWRQVEPVVSGL